MEKRSKHYAIRNSAHLIWNSCFGVADAAIEKCVRAVSFSVCPFAIFLRFRFFAFFLSSPFLHLIRFTYTIFWMCPFLVSEFSGCISNILWRRKHWMACCAYIQRIFKCGRHEKPSFRKKDEQKSDRKRNIETLNIRILFLFYFTPLFISYTLFMCHETIRMVPIILKNITK